MNIMRFTPSYRRTFGSFLALAILVLTFSDLGTAQKIRNRGGAADTGGGVTTSTVTETETTCIGGQINTTGSSASTGSNGNVRTFTMGGTSVKASAFSRRNSDGLWETAFLGAFGSGLGVTDRGELGTDDTHRVDNVGNRMNYILLEFSRTVDLDRVYLDAVLNDSDITVWIGNTNDPFNNHLTLSDALLGSFGPSHESLAANASARWADINPNNKAGNVVVIAASTSDTTPNDWFKLRKLEFKCPPTTTESATITIIKQVTTFDQTNGSNAAFGFSAAGPQVDPSFALSDQNVVGPDRYVRTAVTSFGQANSVTVSEDQAFGWSLIDLDCVSTGGSQFVTNFNAGSVSIVSQAGGSVTCTFVNGLAIPSAAGVSVSGRAVAADMQTGIGGAIVSLFDVQTGETRSLRTNQLGYYSFKDIEVGRFYVLSISHRRYSFGESTRAFSLTEQLSDVNFVQSF